MLGQQFESLNLNAGKGNEILPCFGRLTMRH